MKKFFAKYWFAVVSCLALAVAIGCSIFCFVALGNNDKADTTSIGYIGYGNKTNPDEVKSYLSSRVSSWKKDTEYTIEYQGTIYQIQTEGEDGEKNKLSILDFDADKTYRLAKKNTQGNPAYFNLNQVELEQMYQDMTNVYGLETVNGIDRDKLASVIMSAAQKLTRTIEIPLHTCLTDSVKKYNYSGWTKILSGLEEADVLALDGKEIEINAGYFSLLDAASKEYPLDENRDDLGNLISTSESKYDLRSLTNRQLSILASGMACVIQETSFQAITKTQEENYNVSYSTNSIDDILVMVVRPNSDKDLNSFDFSFVNPEKYSFTFTMEKRNDGEIEFKLTGFKYAYTYEIVKSVKTLEYETVLKDVTETEDFPSFENNAEKEAYLILEGYTRMDLIDFFILYKDQLFESDVTEEEIRNDAAVYEGSYIYIKTNIEGKVGYQVDYYRKIIKPTGETELLPQTIYTVSESFWEIDEEILYCTFMKNA